MITTSTAQHAPAAIVHRHSSAWGYYIFCEFMKALRNPATLIFGIAFPTLFFALFSNIVGTQYAAAVLASYAAYAAFVIPFQSFSNSFAIERGLGWYKLLHTTSLSATLYLMAKLLTIVLTVIVAMLVLFSFAAIFGNVRMGLANWAQLLGAMILGTLPFAVMGLFLGLLASPGVVQVVSTLIFFLLSFASGLFIPVPYLPNFIGQIAPFLPTYHLGQFAWASVGSSLADGDPLWQHFLWLAFYTVVFLVLALLAYRRDENKNFS